MFFIEDSIVQYGYDMHVSNDANNISDNESTEGIQLWEHSSPKKVAYYDFVSPKSEESEDTLNIINEEYSNHRINQQKYEIPETNANIPIVYGAQLHNKKSRESENNDEDSGSVIYHSHHDLLLNESSVDFPETTDNVSRVKSHSSSSLNININVQTTLNDTTVVQNNGNSSANDSSNNTSTIVSLFIPDNNKVMPKRTHTISNLHLPIPRMNSAKEEDEKEVNDLEQFFQHTHAIRKLEEKNRMQSLSNSIANSNATNSKRHSINTPLTEIAMAKFNERQRYRMTDGYENIPSFNNENRIGRKNGYFSDLGINRSKQMNDKMYLSDINDRRQKRDINLFTVGHNISHFDVGFKSKMNKNEDIFQGKQNSKILNNVKHKEKALTNGVSKNVLYVSAIGAVCAVVIIVGCMLYVRSGRKTFMPKRRRSPRF